MTCNKSMLIVEKERHEKTLVCLLMRMALLITSEPYAYREAILN